MTEPRLPVHLRPQEHLPPERPLPDWAPFAVPSDEVWRELQRRRNLISTVRALATAARDEGYTICAVLLADTAERLVTALIAHQAFAGAHIPLEPQALERCSPAPATANAEV